MKNLKLLPLLMLAGCGTLSRTFMSDPTIPPEEKRGYLEGKDKLDAAMAQFRPYHYLAMGLIVFGGYLILGRGNTEGGIACLGTGVCMSAWATYAPTHPREVGIGIAITFIVTIAVIAYRMIRKKVPHTHK